MRTRGLEKLPATTLAKFLSPLCLLFLLGISTSEAARYAYFVDYASVLSVIDTTNPSVVARIPLGSTGSHVLATRPDGRLVYVAMTNSIAVVDTNSRTVITTIPVGQASLFIMNPTRGTLYALTITYPSAGPESFISVIDTSANVVTATINLPSTSFVYDMAALPSGNKVYVAYTTSTNSRGSVIVIDGATNKVISTIAGVAGSFVVDPAGTSVYVLTTSLLIIDTGTDTVIATLAMPSTNANEPGIARTIGFDPSGAWVYVGASDLCACSGGGFNGRVVVIDAARHSIVATISLTLIPNALTITPSGSRIYAAGEVPGQCTRPVCERSGGVAVIDTATRSLLTTIPPPSDSRVATGRPIVVMQPDGALVYSRYYSSIDVIDTRTNTKAAALPPSSGGIIFKPDANPAFGGSLRQYTVQSRSGTSTSMQWGAPGDVPVPADYDGDGKTDIAVFRPREETEEAIWYIVRSSDSVVIRQQWGSVSLGDVPVPADYDGDGRADIAVWRPFEGGWYIRRSSDGQNINFRFATGTDLPTPADFDGDGVADLAAYSRGKWLIFGSAIGLSYPQFGTAADIPVPADYDGDGRVDLAVWNPGTGIWSVLNSSNGAVTTRQWGAPGDIPSPRDFDGDRKADFAIWRPSSGAWLIINSGNGSVTALGWGAPGDLPVPADYDGDGRADASVYRP